MSCPKTYQASCGFRVAAGASARSNLAATAQSSKRKAAPILGTAGFSRKMIGPVIIPPRRATERSVLRAYPRVDCTHDNWRLSRAVVRVSRLSHSSRFAGVVSGWTHASSSSYDAVLLLARPRRSRSLGHHGPDLRHAVRDLRLPSNDPDSGACC